MNKNELHTKKELKDSNISRTSPEFISSIFCLVDVPVSLRGFTASISSLHQFNVDKLIALDPVHFCESNHSRLERLKSYILKGIASNKIKNKKVSSELFQTKEKVHLLTDNLDSASPIKNVDDIELEITNSESRKPQKSKSIQVKKLSDKSESSLYLHQLYEQNVTVTTLLKSITFPNELVSYKSILLENFPNIKVGDLSSVNSKSLKDYQLSAIKTFCRNRLKNSKKTSINSTNSTVLIRKKSLAFNNNNNNNQKSNGKVGNINYSNNEKISIAELNEQIFNNDTLLRTIGLPQTLVEPRNTILKRYPDVTVGTFITSNHQYRKIDRFDLYRLKEFCKRRFVRCNEKLEAKSEKKPVNMYLKNQPQKNESLKLSGLVEKYNILGKVTKNTPFCEVEVPDELLEVKERVELYLGLLPTVGDFLNTSDGVFSNIKGQLVRSLKEFYYSRLSYDTDKIVQNNSNDLDENKSYISESDHIFDSIIPKKSSSPRNLHIRNREISEIMLKSDSSNFEAMPASRDDKEDTLIPFGLGNKVTHITKRGKTLRGWVRDDLTRDDAFSIDEYSFRKGGGWFIREKHESSLSSLLQIRNGKLTNINVNDFKERPQMLERKTDIRITKMCVEQQEKIGNMIIIDERPKLDLEL